MGQKSHPQKIRSKYINSFFESNWFTDNKNYKFYYIEFVYKKLSFTKI